MPNRVISPDASDTTRDRILKAAILRFSTHSYDDTGLRDIAADVGVDMAYVHRSFGSKEKLFYEAVKESGKPEQLFAEDDGCLPSILAKQILSRKGPNEIGALDIVVQSLGSQAASRVLNEFLEEDFVAPLIGKLPSVPRRRAALVAAFLAGVGILKDVIKAEPLLEGERNALEEDVKQVIATLLEVEVRDCDSPREHVPHETRR
ncbi:TetR family transcriptional regulator [Aureimonas altamirensis]|uniref:TetR/AcrR family transcriptional regulator n=1 Tax=Aureimonas altamirensis TaxID=370622 RepID=UPI002554E79C|nr:TetR family transcriptional regulator [Aureimonas altamirensis]